MSYVFIPHTSRMGPYLNNYTFTCLPAPAVAIPHRSLAGSTSATLPFGHSLYSPVPPSPTLTWQIPSSQNLEFFSVGTLWRSALTPLKPQHKVTAAMSVLLKRSEKKICVYLVQAYVNMFTFSDHLFR